MAVTDRHFQILCIDDEEDGALFIKELLARVKDISFDLKWMSDYDEGFQAVLSERYDVCLLDYHLDGEKGLAFLKEAKAKECKIPIIIITGQSDHEVELKAMQRGAADYLIKDRVSSQLMARSIGYSVAQARHLNALKESEERYALVARAVNEGIWDWDMRSDRVFYSSRWLELLGLDPDQSLPHKNTWFDRVFPDDLPLLKEALAQHLEGDSEVFESEVRMQHQEGHELWMHIRGIAVFSENGQPKRMAGLLMDITDLRQAQQQLHDQATRDPLTGMYNRRYLMERLDQAMHVSQRHQMKLSLCMIDLDNFKTINDTYGHGVGDMVLKEFSEMVRHNLRLADLAARFGGDEFCVVFPHTSLSEAVTVVDRLRRDLAGAPLNCDGHSLNVQGTFGVASWDGQNSLEDLIKQADQALYDAKKAGRNCVRSYQG